MSRIEYPNYQPSVSIIILNWNNAPDTLNCLDSIFAQNYQNYHTIIVDNGSMDNSTAIIQEKYPKIEILRTGRNLGYTGGNNYGIRHLLQTSCDYIWLLNDDVVISPNCLSRLIEVAENCLDACFIGPVIYTRENPDCVLSAGGKFLSKGLPFHLYKGKSRQNIPQTSYEVDFISGCALLVRRELVEIIGLLYEPFFAYGEDYEWCYRAGQKGYKSLIVGDARAWHPDTSMRDENSPVVTYYVTRNQLIFQNLRRVSKVILFSTIAGYLRTLLSWSLRPKWRHKRAQRDAMVWAIYDFIAGHTGKWRA
jgi:GT2 family glycosyltransferase